MTPINFLAAPVAIACLLGCAAVPAVAQAQTDPDGNYFGGAAGRLRAGDLDRGALNDALQGQGLAVRTTGVDVNDNGWKVFVGHRFDPHWAVEGGYTFLGRYGFQGQVIADPGAVQASFQADDWNASALATLPVGERCELFGKAGIGLWRTRLETAGTFSALGARAVHASGTGPVAAVGARLRLTASLSARLEFERFFHIGDAAGSGRSDIDFGSLGLQYSF